MRRGRVRWELDRGRDVLVVLKKALGLLKDGGCFPIRSAEEKRGIWSVRYIFPNVKEVHDLAGFPYNMTVHERIMASLNKSKVLKVLKVAPCNEVLLLGGSFDEDLSGWTMSITSHVNKTA